MLWLQLENSKLTTTMTSGFISSTCSVYFKFWFEILKKCSQIEWLIVCIITNINFFIQLLTFLANDDYTKKKQSSAERLNTFMNKYKATLDKTGNVGSMTGRRSNRAKSDVVYTPKDLKYDNKHYKYIKYTKYNKVSTYRFPPSHLFAVYYFTEMIYFILRGYIKVLDIFCCCERVYLDLLWLTLNQTQITNTHINKC